MNKPIRVVVNGASGRMGRILLELLARDQRFIAVGAMASPSAAGLGEPIVPTRSLCLSSDWSVLNAFDVVIDFSSPTGLGHALSACQVHGAALVSGTTGIDAVLRKHLAEAARTVAVLHAGNFSMGVAVMSRLLAQAAAALPDWDLEIVEAHHGRKQDAPSGTALHLGDIAATARGVTLETAGVYAREGHVGPRELGTIGFAVVRGGDIVGEHTVLLAGQGERIELSHRATHRAIFARGAIEAAHWLVSQPPGMHALDQMLAQRLPG